MATDTPVTFRATSADVVHGFLIDGTNINLMLVPGYISSLGARFDTPANA
jgi:cytochrome c oxidase subunit 2